MHKTMLFVVLLILVSMPVFAQEVDTLWVRRYNGPGNDADFATALAVDTAENVYVTGYSWTNETGDDYATVKYYPNGDTAWVRRYTGPGNNFDEPSALVVDASGSVYVTGRSIGSGTGRDYATIKYNASGDTAWVRRYNGLGNDTDDARAVGIDTNGNVYVTGVSVGIGTYSDYVTIKYNVSGDTLWVRRYDGPDNRQDRAWSLAVDRSGNVYVTGESRGGGNSDYATIKYYPNGDTAWVRRYNLGQSVRATAIAVDDSGNVYVTGHIIFAPADFITIKYYSNGETAWIRRYNGIGNGTDWASGLAVDNFRNVYVTGQSYGSGTDFDYAAIKYYPNGDTAWVRRYNGPGNHLDQTQGLAIDTARNVYVTGTSLGSGTSYDYATIKYYPNGDTVWLTRYNAGSDDWCAALAVDAKGYVYVTGASSVSGSSYDYATVKYAQFLRGDANGNGVIEMGDIVYLINYLYRGGPPPEPLAAGDANCDGSVDMGDVVYLTNYLYHGGPPPGCP